MAKTYLNPIYNHNFPDPFVLKYCGEYWAYCTGVWEDGRCFGVLRSRDLVEWSAVGGALEPLPESHPCYWAPEVTYHNGRFYLYYSVGDEATMHIRVAVAERPAGPFIDSGHELTSEPFAIDGHMFVDDDGSWHLFYAADFLDHHHIGTGTVRDLLRDPLTAEGRPRPVTLPRYDWHVYDPQRVEKGGVRWHTVEGPFVLKRKGRYYQMFSGGNWQNISYGVSYATSDRIDGDGEWEQAADGERVLPILRTLPGQVVGPGHNSVVRGPDNRQLFCVYHRWADDGSGRVLAIDPLDWAGERMLVFGPTTSPQPAPLAPTFADFFDKEQEEALGPDWECAGGHWAVEDGAATQACAESGLAEHTISTRQLAVEVSLRALDDPHGGSYGLAFGHKLAVLLAPKHGRLLVRLNEAGRPPEASLPLPHDFDPSAYHLLRVELDGSRIRVALDAGAVRWADQLANTGTFGAVGLMTDRIAASFRGFALTTGWEDLFDEDAADPAALGWRAVERSQDQLDLSHLQGWRLNDRQLWHAGPAEHARIDKDAVFETYELVVNARLDSRTAPDGCYGFYPMLRRHERGPLLTVERAVAGWALVCRDAATTHSFPLPTDFDPYVYQQFRCRKQHGRLTIAWESHQLGAIDALEETTQVGLYAHHAAVGFDMVRVTAIGV